MDVGPRVDDKDTTCHTVKSDRCALESEGDSIVLEQLVGDDVLVGERGR